MITTIIAPPDLEQCVLCLRDRNMVSLVDLSSTHFDSKTGEPLFSMKGVLVCNDCLEVVKNQQGLVWEGESE
ncbi:hypothetical protein C4J81_15475 [Deltaproteobacteria bacterium Smac51]|nr:hypothetical protein C4J81_15475 [Deltaproteobacteria bacterium Smac51]